jgi:hypothetical protein
MLHVAAEPIEPGDVVVGAVTTDSPRRTERRPPRIPRLGSWCPAIDWEKQAAYCFQRVVEHGRGRSEEMREVAVTIRDAGLEPWSAAATVEGQEWIADLADEGVFGWNGGESLALSSDWRAGEGDPTSLTSV